MSTLTDTKKHLAEIDAALEQARRRAADPATDLDEVATELSRLQAKKAILTERLADLEATERQGENDRAAKAAQQAQQQAKDKLRARQAELTARWAAWGAHMTEIDAALPGLWAEYRSMAQEALALGQDARALGLTLAPDTEPAAGVLRRILSGESGVKDRRRQ